MQLSDVGGKVFQFHWRQFVTARGAENIFVIRLSLSQFAYLVDVSLVNALVRIRKAPADERLPMFLGNRPERIVSARPIQRAIAVQHHLLNQMFAAAQEEIAYLPMILNHAPQLPLHVVAVIFEDLLKLIKYLNFPSFIRVATMLFA
ncbi:MAG: hypothetical protein ACYDH9_12710 [Limisphaerales bacterium]